MKIIRVFPRKTNATPLDENVRIGEFPGLFDEADEVHISVTFTWDLLFAEILYNQWKYVTNTKIGGCATGSQGGEFEPGMYIKNGLTITSRGCNNKCWFCYVWKREGTIRELSIKPGYNILDDNLLSCSKKHIYKVFKMLSDQKKRPKFTGGLEAKLLTEEYAKLLYNSKPDVMYFANDTVDDYEHLVKAGKLLIDTGFTKKSHRIRSYVLVGYPKDTINKALERIKQTWRAGFFPFAMLYRNDKGLRSPEWIKFAREWANPTIIGANLKKL